MKKSLLATTALLLVILLLSASPASAGKISLQNNTSDWNCYAMVDTYLFGQQTRMWSSCAMPHQSNSFHTSLSTGLIIAYCVYRGSDTGYNKCTTFDSSYMAHPTEMKEYKVGGTWLPHRSFTVAITQNGGKPCITLCQGSNLNYTITED